MIKAKIFKPGLILTLAAGLFADIFIFNYFYSDLLTLAIFIIFLITVWKNNIRLQTILFWVIIFLSGALIFRLSDKFYISQRFEVWMYLFFITGLFLKTKSRE